MAVVQNTNRIIELAQAADPMVAIINAVGDLSGYEPMSDIVLVGIYFRPEKTSGGIIRPTDNLKEDQFQSKVGLVLKKGPTARGNEPEIDIHQWITFRIADTFALSWRGVPCREVPYEYIRSRIKNPEDIF